MNYKIIRIENWPLKYLVDNNNDQQQQFFPKLKYPAFFYETLNKDLSLKDFYPTLNKPSYPFLQKIENETIVAIKTFFSVCFFISILLFFLLGWLFSAMFGDSFIVYILMVSSIISLVISYITYYSTGHLNKEKISSNEYRKQTHERDLIEYNRIIETTLNPHNIATKKKEILKEQLESFKNFFDSPFGLSQNQVTKRGISERYFAEKLRAKLNYQVIENSKFGYYFPDFIVYDLEHHIYMNVEIDEPYEFETGLPIHCMDDDDSRDDYFLRNGFIVLRFSESQIIEKTDGCIDLIKSTFENFINLKPIDENVSFPKLRPIKS